MTPKRSRLTKETIERHLIRARRVKTPRFLILYALIPGLKGPQVSFSASKKIAPTAVLRNKLRRRGYAAIRPLIPKLSPGAAILISYTTKEIKTPLAELAAEIEEALKNAGFLK